MARYFFDVHTGDELIRDMEGTELPDQQEVKKEARQTLAQVVKDKMEHSDTHTLYINVNDADRMLVYTITLSVTGKCLGSTFCEKELMTDPALACEAMPTSPDARPR